MIVKKTTQSHDNFFRKAISHPKVARDFFEFHLPAKVKDIIDLDTLTPQKESFLDNTLGQGIVDVLFEVKFGKEQGYLFLLLEHQNKPDRFMPFRMHKYMLRICDNHLKKHPKSKNLPLIYPAIFYAGLEKYNAPLDLWSLFTEPKLAKSFFVDPMQLIDLQNIVDEELRKHIWSGIMQYVMKRIFAQDILPFYQRNSSDH
jgi:predicted transposase/invertase (TIGR01784 family)